MKSYKIRTETIIDIIETIPRDRVKVLMSELTEVDLQSKLSFDVIKALDADATAALDPFVWKDDGKGEVVVHHNACDGKATIPLMGTRRTVKGSR